MAHNGTLGPIGSLPVNDINEALAGLSVAAQVQQQFYSQGFAPPAAMTNGFKGDLPPDITSITDDQLGDLLNNMSQYLGFVEFKLAEAELSMTEAEAKKEFIRARIRLNLKSSGEKMTDKTKNDIVETDRNVLTIEREVLYFTGYYDMLKVVRNNVQKNWETVSRRITQRGQAIERQMRGVNVGNMPVPNSRSAWSPGR